MLSGTLFAEMVVHFSMVIYSYNYTLLKGKRKVDGELGLIFFCYNLRRSISILGVQGILERLWRLFSLFWRWVSPWSLLLGNNVSGESGYQGAGWSAVA